MDESTRDLGRGRKIKGRRGARGQAKDVGMGRTEGNLGRNRSKHFNTGVL